MQHPSRFSLEDDADEGSYSQHEDRCEGKDPNHPKLFAILIGLLLVAKCRGHRNLLVKSTGACLLALGSIPECDGSHISLVCEET
jgi:hypothetical protein